ncbi:phospholipase D-like domain-containing protein [Microvirga sp.]|uniref:phospholipase D-like domain-containing protein n=1 Tax=Microvirga sp. TaxID=1873136 RepID=UPI001FEECA89|nr:phospholipase D-like domain-containing protein [Microvirga sp.]
MICSPSAVVSTLLSVGVTLASAVKRIHTGQIYGDSCNPLGTTRPPLSTERLRQRSATWLASVGNGPLGRILLRPKASTRSCPETLSPTLEDVELGIARTQPAYNGQSEAREIEALYLRTIGNAKDVIYVESQFLASHAVCDALAARLEQSGGPEVVIIVPLTAEGRLEEETMGTARVFIARRLRQSDGDNRLCLLYPTNASGTPIYVHAKIMIVDDRFLRVGSSNLNNRSMGLDTECDIAVEIRPGVRNEEVMRAAIRAARNDLLAEHLGVALNIVKDLYEAGRSPVQIIDLLARSNGRSLHHLPLPDLNPAEEQITASQFLDPEKPEAMLHKLLRLTS